MPAPPPSLDLGFSDATSTATALDIAAGTVFNFSSPGARGDIYGFTTTQTPTATATTAQKSPGANSPVTPSQTLTPTNFAPVNSNPYLIPLIGAGAAILVLILLINKK